MISQKLRFAFGMALAVGLGIAMQMSPVSAEDQQQPAAESDQAAPAAPGAEGGTGTLPAAEAPQDGAATAPSAEPAQDSGTTTEAPKGSEPTGNAPEGREAPAATDAQAPSDSAPASQVSASELKIGATVYGADGAKIGEVNGVKSDDAGKVQEILVTDGVAAGINAKVFAISADKITSVSDGVKLSLSSEETKKLPIIDNSNG